jgi:mono/diheme cytochrome c family protein
VPRIGFTPRGLFGRLLAAWLLAAPPVILASTVLADDAQVAHGAYVFQVAGCYGCHTDVKGGGKPLAGGRPLKTPFGTFYGPNITPDPTYGIGNWSEADFKRALRQGRAPDGAHLYPAFPYAAFTRMTDADIAALWAYLRTQPAVAQPNKPHELDFPFGFRFLLAIWKWLYFTPGPMPDDGDSVARGAYLVRALGHCGECHTPRTLLGGLDSDRELAGNPDGIEGDKVPNITPQKPDGIGGWSQADMDFLLTSGLLPDGDVVGGAMGDVVEHSTRHLTPDDRKAVYDYLQSLPPLPD